MIKFYINKLDELSGAASEILKRYNKSKIFALYGKMGSGKTTFIKYLCKELGTEEEITSPTFAIVNQYNLTENNRIYHFDFYRIETIEEVYDLGYEDYFYSGNYCFVEWPELIESLLPEKCIKIKIETIAENKRTIVLKN